MPVSPAHPRASLLGASQGCWQRGHQGLSLWQLFSDTLPALWLSFNPFVQSFIQVAAAAAAI